MHLKIFGPNIIVPVKHGTRYLEKVFGDGQDDWSIGKDGWFPKKLWKKDVYYLLYRDPYDHLCSALHTELLIHQNYDPQPIETTLQKFISKEGTTHWQPGYLKGIHWNWSHSTNRDNLKFVELKGLLPLLGELGYSDLPEYNPEEYEFHNLSIWKSKAGVIRIVREGYPLIWEFLMKEVKSERVYYKLIKKRCVLSKRIVNRPIKLRPVVKPIIKLI